MMTKTAVKLMVAGAIAAGLLIAQGPRFGRSGAGPNMPNLDRLAAVLNLTDSQAQQAKVIFDAAEAATQALEPNIAQAQSALHNAVKTNNTAEIDKSAAALGALLGQARAIHAKALAQFYLLLTPAQREQFDKFDTCPFGCGMGMMGGRFGQGPHR